MSTSSPLWDGVREGCGSCFSAGPINQHDVVECRLHPPVLVVVSFGQLNNGADQVEQHRPYMAVSDWCSHWKRRP